MHMTKIYINEKEYESNDFTPEQTEIVNLLNLGQNSLGLLNHILKCTQSVHQMKTEELKKSLEGPQTIGDLFDKKADTDGE